MKILKVGSIIDYKGQRYIIKSLNKNKNKIYTKCELEYCNINYCNMITLILTVIEI